MPASSLVSDRRSLGDMNQLSASLTVLSKQLIKTIGAIWTALFILRKAFVEITVISIHRSAIVSSTRRMHNILKSAERSPTGGAGEALDVVDSPLCLGALFIDDEGGTVGTLGARGELINRLMMAIVRGRKDGMTSWPGR